MYLLLARPRFLGAFAFTVLSLLPPGANAQLAAPASALPLYVIGPPNSQKINEGLCFRELFEHPDEWKQTRAITNALLYADWPFREFSDADLTTWFGQMRDWNMKLELEVGGIKPWGVTGEGTFTKEKKNWDRILRLGGNINSIAMDEPLSCVRRELHLPDEYAHRANGGFYWAGAFDLPEHAGGRHRAVPFDSAGGIRRLGFWRCRRG